MSFALTNNSRPFVYPRGAGEPGRAGERPDRSLRLLMWLYFWLLLWEGALRKWIFPSMSTPLLIVRDPVVILIYLVALAKGVFPFNRYILLIVALGGLSFVASQLVFDHLGIILYGLRTNFLHLPLIFLMPKVLNHEDVTRIGRWFLLLSVPMTFLVIWQFVSPQGAWINAAAGGELGGQMIATGGRIRPAGIFSFVTGMVSFLGVVAAFLLGGSLDRDRVPNWLRTLPIPCLVFSLVLSGSRSALVGVTIIIVVAILICVRQFSRVRRCRCFAKGSRCTRKGFGQGEVWSAVSSEGIWVSLANRSI
jgi:hypothetical protein